MGLPEPHEHRLCQGETIGLPRDGFRGCPPASVLQMMLRGAFRECAFEKTIRFGSKGRLARRRWTRVAFLQPWVPWSGAWLRPSVAPGVTGRP
ncbi:hypothetical protein DSCA_18040 [Desulfosarcina alkanivorans]|uniref:Uncharacterized protein n=1 Tax=Desulfosarcina alkanivorans TaxID=571177 RepID=A0A5K7YNG1_9BACT|nr:hypothetical protein DSCA_18040 [Desulfosarcina alkanivorans]